MSEILHDGFRVTGIRLENGSSVMADVVVANADASQVYSSFSHMRPVEMPAIYLCSTTGHGWDWNDREYSRSYAEKIIDQIESRGIEIRSRLELLKIRTPADLERETFAPGGSIYGTSSNGARAAFLRAKNRSPLRGLFCVGGSAHPGGGLPLVGISSEIVANAIGRA
ncbi:MAG: hypothetical protein Q8K86_05580 [Candidatus Nanopelagicaceae bacterium]|nr:hypothetical protein [Candidatus Nanopelagicaceae bacterium]